MKRRTHSYEHDPQSVIQRRTKNIRGSFIILETLWQIRNSEYKHRKSAWHLLAQRLRPSTWSSVYLHNHHYLQLADRKLNKSSVKTWLEALWADPPTSLSKETTTSMTTQLNIVEEAERDLQWSYSSENPRRTELNVRRSIVFCVPRCPSFFVHFRELQLTYVRFGEGRKDGEEESISLSLVSSWFSLGVISIYGDSTFSSFKHYPRGRMFLSLSLSLSVSLSTDGRSLFSKKKEKKMVSWTGQMPRFVIGMGGLGYNGWQTWDVGERIGETKWI